MTKVVDSLVIGTDDTNQWNSSLEILDTSASVTLPATATVFKAPTIASSDGILYDTTTGIITMVHSGSYILNFMFNATPPSAGKSIYFYAEIDTGAGWQKVQYSGRALQLPNAVETQVIGASSNYYPAGTKLRVYVWGSVASIVIKTTEVVTGVSIPAFRFMIA